MEQNGLQDVRSLVVDAVIKHGAFSVIWVKTAVSLRN